MKLLLTGASGFLGKILQSELTHDFEIIKVGRNNSNDITCDLKNEVPTISKADYVIHAAGKAHVYPRTEEEKKEFYDVNVVGTENLLKALEAISIQKFVFISSVSVYGLEGGELIDEQSSLNGNSPYAKSKIEAETIIQNWCKERNIAFLILRLPLIVGPNPLGNLGKMIDAMKRGRYVRIAKGNAKKSMVLASDVALLIKGWFQEDKSVSGIYNLTDGVHPTFFEMEEAIRNNLQLKKIVSIPFWIASLLGKIGDTFSKFPVNSGTIGKITGTFTFCDAKARKELNWQPRSVIKFIK